MSPADDTRTRNGAALTLTWPQPDIALVTMIREREMNTLSLELLGELDEALTASVNGRGPRACHHGAGPRILRRCASALFHRRRCPNRRRQFRPTRSLSAADRFGLRPHRDLADPGNRRHQRFCAGRWLRDVGGLRFPVDGRSRQDRRPRSPDRRSGRCRRGTKTPSSCRPRQGAGMDFARQSCPGCRSSGSWPRHRGPSRCGVLPAAMELAGRFRLLGPRAVAQSKMAVRLCGDTDLTTARNIGLDALAMLIDGPEWQEGMKAFMEKREPRFPPLSPFA